MSEENGARMRAESRVVEVEKQCSMLEFDLKQSVQKMEQLMKQKERLEDEASGGFFYQKKKKLSYHICTISPLPHPLSRWRVCGYKESRSWANASLLRASWRVAYRRWTASGARRSSSNRRSTRCWRVSARWSFSWRSWQSECSSCFPVPLFISWKFDTHKLVTFLEILTFCNLNENKC